MLEVLRHHVGSAGIKHKALTHTYVEVVSGDVEEAHVGHTSAIVKVSTPKNAKADALWAI